MSMSITRIDGSEIVSRHKMCASGGSFGGSGGGCDDEDEDGDGDKGDGGSGGDPGTALAAV